MYVNVIINISNKNVDVIYTYKLDSLPSFLTDISEVIGYSVIVPFGNGNKNRQGYIIDTTLTTTYNLDKIKSVISFPNTHKIFTPTQIKLALWMREKYFCTTFDCLKLMKPVGMTITSNDVYQLNELSGSKPPDIGLLPFSASRGGVSNPIHPNKSNESDKLTKKESDIVDYIKTYIKVSEKELIEEFGNSAKSALKKLKERKILTSLQISKVHDLTLRIKQVSINYENINIDRLLSQIKLTESKQHDVIELLEQNGKTPVIDVLEALKITISPIETLAKKNILTIQKEEIRRNSIFNIESKMLSTKNFDPTEEQKNAIEMINKIYYNTIKKPILIHGVTGSGKTEIYMQIIEKVLMENKQCIMLVPEISLTPQIVSIFLGRFGKLVSVTHSRLSMGERFDQWKKARDGEISIMIGPRSALFTPFSNLGIIIIDEEHEHTYKSDTTPKYDTIHVAEKLAMFSNCLLVLGSATPRLGSFKKALDEEYQLITLKNRVNNSFPETIVNDMRMELIKGNRSIFSIQLQDLMLETLNNDKQIMLFLNRRGFSNFVSCRDCGYVVMCETCNVNYTYHKYNNSLICHYCNSSIKCPENCPTCGSKHIRHFGIGTQRVEEEVKKLFPLENVLRMDFDTTSKKNSHEKILDQFRKKESRILIGTQMIAKGLDFPHVTLVGVIAADLSLHAGDFQGAENTFQLITQVAGRAGRSDFPGKVVIQTYNAEHYSIVHAKNNDYISFYNEEIAMRRQMKYPPFTNIFTIMFTSIDERQVILMLNRLMDIMIFYNKKGFFEMLGPSKATISKLKNKYRWKIIVKGEDYDLLVQFNLFCLEKLKKIEALSEIDIYININPRVIL